MTYDMAANIAAFEQTVRSTIAVAETFGEAEWDEPTDCPGWTVKDIASHLVSMELLLLGEPLPEHPLPDDLPHVSNDMARMMEVGVDVRRPVPGAKVLGELRQVLDRRLAALAHTDPEQPAMAPTGRTVSYAEFMVFRAFDCWAHEQDIRRAVGRPGNLDTPAALCARTILRRGLPFVVGKKAAAVPGQSVVFDITGPAAFTAYVQIGDDGRGRDAAALPAATTVDRDLDALPAATATLRMDWETYVRLAAGRCSPGAVAVSTSGDEDLAERVLANMSVTP